MGGAGTDRGASSSPCGGGEAGFSQARSTPPAYSSLFLSKGVAQSLPSLASLTLRTDDPSSEAGSCSLAGNVGAMMSTLVQGQLRPCAAYSTHHHLCGIP